MSTRILLKLIVVVFVVFGIVLGSIAINHPIVIKWLCGSARIIGRPIQATVFTDGQINSDIKVFHVDKYWGSHGKANNFLLSLSEFDTLGILKFFNINLNEKWIGRPVGTSKKDYDFIGGRLLQSETGGHFTPFQDDTKGFNFDPQLSFTSSQIKFNLPPHLLKFDSVRIEFK